MAILLLLALAIPATVSGLHNCPASNCSSEQKEASWETLPPVYLSTAGPNITVLLRGMVLDIGNHTSLNFTWTSTTALWGDRHVITGLEYSTDPEDFLLTSEVEMLPGTQYSIAFVSNIWVAGFEVWVSDRPITGNEWDGFVTFTTPVVGQVVSPETHPLAPHITNLGLPIAITLGVIGIIIMVIPLALIAILGRNPGNTEFLPVFILAASANVFLRLWPAILAIFLFLFLGWVLISRLGGGET